MYFMKAYEHSRKYLKCVLDITSVTFNVAAL